MGNLNTYRIIDGGSVEGRCGGPEGNSWRRCGQYVDGSFGNDDSRRFHADPVRAVILSEGGTAKETNSQRSTISVQSVQAIEIQANHRSEIILGPLMR